MAVAGIVGDYTGSQAREALITIGEWDALQKQVIEDLKAGYEADREDPEEGSETASWAEVPATTDNHDIRG